MNNRLLTLAFAGILLLGTPVGVLAGTAVEIFEQDVQQANVVLQGATLHVQGASGQMLYIYNVAGVRVMSIKIEGADKRIELNLPKGCYIVKVGKTVRKISIK